MAEQSASAVFHPDDPGETRADAGDERPSGHWDSFIGLSSVQRGLVGVQRNIEGFLAHRVQERAPWLAVGFGTGIAGWLATGGGVAALALIALCAAVAALAAALVSADRAGLLRQSVMAMALMAAAGCTCIALKSALVGVAAVPARETVLITARIIARHDDIAAQAAHLVVATRLEARGHGVLVRLTIPADGADRAQPGAVIAARARLAPPAAPLVPGMADRARDAWFRGIAAEGSAPGVRVLQPAPGATPVARWQTRLRDHVLAHLGGPAGAIAATLASGDHGAIARGDAEAMRIAGFAHLLSISGLHVGVVMGASFWLVLRVLACFSWLALRLRLPLVAGLAAALAGIGYAMLTGAEVPTLRAASGAVLVLGALALGRDPLSLRLLAIAALLILMFWPESLFGAGFQLSFGAVAAVIAWRESGWVRAYAAKRDADWWQRAARRVVVMALGGAVITLAVAPIALWHFQRAGLYGAIANVFAIPLVLVVAMPAIALALVLDAAGLGAPAWWVAGTALDAVLGIAHLTARLPGAAAIWPPIPGTAYGLWVCGALWLALWSGQARWWGAVPMLPAAALWWCNPLPDLWIAGDGAHVMLAGPGRDIAIAGDPRATRVRMALAEAAGSNAVPAALEDRPGARCSHDACAWAIARANTRTVLMVVRSHRAIAAPALAQACAQSDVVVADHPLPGCRPRRLLADSTALARTGGITLSLATGAMHTVAQANGVHPWTVGR